MVLKYMVSGTDLEKPELRQPETEVDQPRRKAVQPAREVIQPKSIRPSSRKRVKLWLLLMTIVILGVVVYCLWPAGLISSTLESLPTNKVAVRAIVYSEENASAIVSDRIVHEGDMINGYKVAKIYRDKVEFEKDGKSFTKQVSK
ncbi:MAG TPA: hypothetical protein VMW72_21030 [Sedimentisphaerales bacterium]|nr:hypothetical protein [Sedimentisphaerales bacterium]